MTLCATLSETLKTESEAENFKKKGVPNAPFHLCHGQTLSCDEVFCKRSKSTMSRQRVAGAVMGFRLRGASV